MLLLAQNVNTDGWAVEFGYGNYATLVMAGGSAPENGRWTGLFA